MIYVTISAVCDCGAEEETQPMVPASRSLVGDVRREITQRGWEIRPGASGYDAVCPKCQSEGAQ